jgi:nucleotide-binding universal stress UspA family protein
MDAERWILVPLDGSTRAEAVLPHAVAMARTTGHGLLLMQAIVPDIAVEPVLWSGGIMPGTSGDGLLEVHQESARAYLRSVATRLVGDGVAVRSDVVVDASVVEAIVEHAGPQVALIAMTTHGRSGLPRLVLGSVAERVLHEARVPLLLVRAGEQALIEDEPLAYRRVLVPLDGSPFAEQALTQAHAIARCNGATLRLAGVVPNADDRDLSADNVPSWQQVRAQLRCDELQAYLDYTADQLAREGLTARVALLRGEPAQALLGNAKDEQVDLVIMATHGRIGLPRLVFGSVATDVLRHATTPVLLIHASEPSALSVATTQSDQNMSDR